MQIKVLSWNIWTDGYFDQVTNFLRSAKADIIGLQEVESDETNSDTINFLEKLGYKHVFAPVKKDWGDRIKNDGPAVFSKHKILDSQIFILSKEDSRAAVKADIQIGDKILHIFSTHLIHTHQQPSEVQEEQAQTLLKNLPAENIIVMGDFNATPESSAIKSMRKVLVDSDPLSQPTWSMYPEGCMVCNPQEVNIRLDYIFTSKDLKTSAFKVENSKGSDHLPISVIVEI